jgi:hypothetical protein
MLRGACFNTNSTRGSQRSLTRVSWPAVQKDALTTRMPRSRWI